MVETRSVKKEAGVKKETRRKRRQAEEDLLQDVFKNGEEDEEKEDDREKVLGQFKPNQQKKYIVGNKFFPIYADSEGHYQADTVKFQATTERKGKIVNISVPYLLLVHINFRIAFIAQYPTKYNTEEDEGFGQKKSVKFNESSKSALQAFRTLQEEDIPDLIEEAQEKMKGVPNTILDVKTLQVDEGSEFAKDFLVYLKEKGIHRYVVEPGETSKRGMGIVERMVRTLRQDVDRFRRSGGKVSREKPGSDVRYKREDIKKAETRLPVKTLTAILHRVVDKYNKEAPHRYVRKMKRRLQKKAVDENMKLGTAITPFSLLENGRQTESKIIEYQQRITKNRGDYWRTRTNKILEDGGNPIKWPDKLKAFDKVNTKNIQFKKAGGSIHTYQKRHRGQQLSVHAGQGNNPVETSRRGDGSLRIDSGTVRSIGFDDTNYRYLPYDFYLEGDGKVIEQRRRENKNRRGRGSQYSNYAAWKKQRAIIQRQTKQEGKRAKELQRRRKKKT